MGVGDSAAADGERAGLKARFQARAARGGDLQVVERDGGGVVVYLNAVDGAAVDGCCAGSHDRAGVVVDLDAGGGIRNRERREVVRAGGGGVFDLGADAAAGDGGRAAESKRAAILVDENSRLRAAQRDRGSG